MILRNPTDKKVRIVLDGEEYEIEAGKCSENIPEERAHRWLETHRFLRVESEVETPSTIVSTVLAQEESSGEAVRDTAIKEATEVSRPKKKNIKAKKEKEPEK